MNRIQLWSCGGGRQSVLMLGLIKRGDLPRPDHACMVDTNRERASTWRYVHAVIRPELESLGIPFTMIDRSKYATVDLWSGEDGESLLIPAFTTAGAGGGKLPEFCSIEWKQRPVMRWAAEQEGWKARGVDSWLGITIEEARRRRNSKTLWFQSRFPLLDAAPSHVKRVYELCEQFGWPEPVRSCCWMCPNMANQQWRDMRDNDPADFAKACALDDQIRERDPHAYVHQSRQPQRLAGLGKDDPPGLFGGCTSGLCY